MNKLNITLQSIMKNLKVLTELYEKSRKADGATVCTCIS